MTPELIVGALDDNHATLILSADIGSTVTLNRVAGGRWGQVRGSVNVETTDTETVFTDYELPQNVPLSYVAKVRTGDDLFAVGPVEVGVADFGGDVLFDLAKPYAGMRIHVEGVGEALHDVSSDLQTVWEREDPVVVSGVRLSPSFPMTFITLTHDERERFLSIIRTGNVVAFSPWRPDYGMESLTYLFVGKVREVRPSRLGAEPARRWVCDVQKVEMPPASYIYPTGTVTFGELRDSGITFGELMAKFYYQVAGL